MDTNEIKSNITIDKLWIDKLSLFISNLFGSIFFLTGSIAFFTIWIVINSKVFDIKPFDPYPFNLLVMMVSLFAIILSISVLMSQKRQGHVEKMRQQIEFEVNVRAEHEITKMLKMLHEIQKKLGIDEKDDKELNDMKETIDIQELHEQITNIESEK